MKKIISLSLSILLTICLVSTVYAASSCKVSLQTKKNTFVKDEEISVDVVLSDIQDEKGIFGVSAILEYDKNSLGNVKIEEQEGWADLTFSEENGIIGILRDKVYATTDQTVFKITFKAKVENADNVKIVLKDVRATNGDKDIKLGDLTKIVTIKTNNDDNKPGDDDNNKPGDDTNKPGDDNNKPGDDTNKPGDDNNNPGDDTNKPGDDNNKPGDDTNKPANNNKPTNNTGNGSLPNTGSTNSITIIIAAGIAILAIAGAVLYTKIRKINKMKEM